MSVLVKNVMKLTAMNNLKAIKKTLKKLEANLAISEQSLAKFKNQAKTEEKLMEIVLTKNKKLTKQTKLIKDLESKLACQTCQGKVQQILHGLGYNKFSHLCKEEEVIKHSIHVYTNYRMHSHETERISHIIKEYFPLANMRIY